MKIVIANANPIHHTIEKKCADIYDAVLIREKDQLTAGNLERIKPDFIFFLHWSYIIPEVVYKNFTCIVFHMTDLPFGRGGSPLQNLIVRGLTETALSAIQVQQGIDTGPVYLKKKLFLGGTAEEIFLRAGKIMFEMIGEIITNDLKPVPQEGEVVTFKRRTPAESNLDKVLTLDEVYDMIRMLDAQGYPKAFLETEFFRFEFSRASMKADGIIADVKITRK